MQNRRLWTAGSKTKKLRGLSKKNRGGLELFLHCSGLRVYFKGVQGVFSKMASAKGYLQIWSIGSRSEASRLFGSGSNLERRSQIKRLGPNWAQGRRRFVAGELFRGGVRWGVTGLRRFQPSGGRFDPCLIRAWSARYA